MIEDKTPLEAFEWLLGRFRAYARNEIIWLEVRKILAAGEEYIAKAKEPVEEHFSQSVLLSFEFDEDTKPSLEQAAMILDVPLESLDKDFNVCTIDPDLRKYVVKHVPPDGEIKDDMLSNPEIGTFAAE